MIEIKRNVVLFALLTIGAVYFIFEKELGDLFSKYSFQELGNAILLDEEKNLSENRKGRNMLAYRYAENEYLFESPPSELELGNRLKHTTDVKVKDRNKRSITRNQFEGSSTRNLRRRKRKVQHKDNFSWNIDLNISRHGNKLDVPQRTEENLQTKANERRYLDMAVHVEGGGSDNSYKELNQAWDSVGSLIKKLYGDDLSELEEKDRGISVKVSTEPNFTKQVIQTVATEKGREGKFLFGLLNFGGNNENPPVEGSGEVFENVKTEHNTEALNENGESPITLKDLDSIQVSTILGSTELSFEAGQSTLRESTVGSVTEAFEDAEDNSDLGASTKLMKASTQSGQISVPSTTSRAEPSFTSEELKEFCISLLSNVKKELPISNDEFSNHGSGNFSTEEKRTIPNFDSNRPESTNNTTDKPNSQRFGFFASILNRFLGRDQQRPQDTKSSSMAPEQSSTLSNEKDSIQETTLNGNTKISINLDEGSRIPTDEDSLVTEQDDDNTELTVSDCESFFKKMPRNAVFSKPNLLDIINNPSLLSQDLSQFNFTEERDENPQRSMRSGFDVAKIDTSTLSSVKMTNNSEEAFLQSTNTATTDKIALDFNIQKGFSVTETYVPTTLHFKSSNQDVLSTVLDNGALDDFQGSSSSGTIGNSDVRSLVTEKEHSFRTSATEKPSIYSNELTTVKTEVFIKTISDQRISTELNYADNITVHPLDKKSLENSTEIESRFFGNLLNIGSEERTIQGFDVSSTQITGKDNFHLDLVNFGSGERVLDDSFPEDEQETSSRVDGRIFGGLFNFGNGESQKDDAVKPVDNQGSKVIDEIGTPLQPTQEPSDGNGLSQEEISTKVNNEVDIQGVRLPEQTSLVNALDIGSGDVQERRFFSFFDILGSGDGRELSETSTSEIPECIDCSPAESLSFDQVEDVDVAALNNGTENPMTVHRLPIKIGSNVSLVDDKVHLDNGTDYYPEYSISNETNYYPEYSISNETNYYPESTQQYNNVPEPNAKKSVPSVPEIYTDYSLGYESSKNNYALQETTLAPREYIESKYIENYSVDVTEPFSKTASSEATTAPEDESRFLDTLFLTGSGEGGLFGNDNGEINLVQEIEPTSPSNFVPQLPRRRARLDDLPDIPWHVENIERIPEEGRSVNSLDPQGNADNIQPHSNDKSSINTVVGNENEIILDSLAIEPMPNSDDALNYPKFTTRTEQSTDKNLSRTTVGTGALNILTSTSFNIYQRARTTESSQTFCNSASECEVKLNERCISLEGRGVCNCGRSFVRHPETMKCEAPVMLKTSLKLPGEVFHRELRVKSSKRFQKKRQDAIETMWMLLGEDPHLLATVANVDVTGFEEGSLVIHVQLALAVEGNETITELVQQVDADLKEAFEDEALLKRAPLNVENASLLSVSGDVNPCEKRELNYCSKNAECVRGVDKRGFTCRCKEEFLDTSRNSLYPGEICIATCPPDYCGENGYCELKGNGERYCLCNGWYFGNMCEISGIVVVASFGALNVMIIVMVFVAICSIRRRRRCQTRFYGSNQIRFQPDQEIGRFSVSSPRLAGTIALDDIGPTKTSKYMAISTPLYKKPDINITSPTITGSSISYDFDSTFDRSPSATGVKVDPPIYDTVANT